MSAAGMAGVILAGGRSQRMGRPDKFLRPLSGRPIIAHVVERLAPQVGDLAINANGDPERLEALGLAVFPDGIDGFQGPLAGILAALDWAAGRGFACVVTAAADTPFLPIDLVEILAGTAERLPGAIAVAASGGRLHPVFALWPTHLRDDLRHCLTQTDERRVIAFIERHPMVSVDFAVTDGVDPFFNINTPADLAVAQARAAEQQ